MTKQEINDMCGIAESIIRAICRLYNPQDCKNCPVKMCNILISEIAENKKEK